MRVPAMMKAIVVHQFGPPSVLQLHEVSVPIPGEGQALIRLHATGVNFSDTERRRGVYAAPRLPWRPGSEGAGVVVDVGANVERSWMDRRVAFWAMPPAVSGAYAEFALAPVEALMDLGDDINFETGAALPLQGLTAYGLAIRAVDIRPGQIVLVHSAAGGVGQILVQIARLKGARVIGTASSVEKCNAIRELGAEAIVYGPGLIDEVRRASGGGVNVIFDAIGKPMQIQNLKMLAPFGILMHYGEAGGPPDPISPEILYAKCLKVGSFGLDVSFEPERWVEARKQLVDWLRKGELRLSVSRCFSLSDAARAHEFLESRQSTGKVILIPGDG